MKNRLLCLLIALACALAVTGCGRQTQSTEQEETETVSLELGEDKPESESKEPESEPEDSEQQKQPQEDQAQLQESGLAGSESDKPDESSEQEPSTPVTEEAKEQAPVTGTQSLPFSQQLQTRSAEELADNPQKLDTRLYAVFANVMDEHFDRKQGTLSVYRLNYDGTEGAYELKFDITNAYDEEGHLNKNASIQAEMKVAETLQSNFNYGQGDRETYSQYQQYAQTLEWLKSPLLCEGFALKNFSSLTLTQQDGLWRIKAIYTPEALQELYDQEIYGEVSAFMDLDDEGNLQLLRWEQREEIDGYPTVIACGEYSFS